MILYHYTSREAYKKIKESGVILHSDSFIEKFMNRLIEGRFSELLHVDSDYGAGLYFTNLSPNECNVTIMHHCWQDVTRFEKIERYIKYDVPYALLIYCRQHVYLLPRSIGNGKAKFLARGKMPKCNKRPCTSCSNWLRAVPQ